MQNHLLLVISNRMINSFYTDMLAAMLIYKTGQCSRLLELLIFKALGPVSGINLKFQTCAHICKWPTLSCSHCMTPCFSSSICSLFSPFSPPSDLQGWWFRSVRSLPVPLCRRVIPSVSCKQRLMPQGIDSSPETTRDTSLSLTCTGTGIYSNLNLNPSRTNFFNRRVH